MRAQLEFGGLLVIFAIESELQRNKWRNRIIGPSLVPIRSTLVVVGWSERRPAAGHLLIPRLIAARHDARLFLNHPPSDSHTPRPNSVTLTNSV